MKKTILILIFSLFATFSFAISNIKFYLEPNISLEIKDDNIYDESGNIVIKIQDNELFEAESNTNIGRISENSEKVCIYLSLTDDYSISWEYEKETSLLLQISFYKDNIIRAYKSYEYENNKIIKERFFDIEDNIEAYLLYSYEKKIFKTSLYDENNKLVEVTEYDNNSKNKIKSCKYNDDGSKKNQTLYDKDSGNAMERYVYFSNLKKNEKYVFIQFDNDGKYSVNDNFFLSSAMCDYSSLEKYAEDSKNEPVEWNEKNRARVSKYDFSSKDDGYKYMQDLIQNHYLSEKSFVLCNYNTDIYYCFAINDDDEIDMSSCYKIELIKNPTDYSIFKKNDKNSGPFGFCIGMTYEEIREVCKEEPEYIKDNCYYVKPKKTHPLFEKYIVWISDKEGLYIIKAISKNIYTSKYGKEVKNEFNNLLSSLQNKYGKFNLTDTVKSDFILKDEQYWMYGLLDGARQYFARWYSESENFINSNGVWSIGLGIEALSYSDAYIWLEYDFFNSVVAEKEKDDVL